MTKLEIADVIAPVPTNLLDPKEKTAQFEQMIDTWGEDATAPFRFGNCGLTPTQRKMMSQVSIDCLHVIFEDDMETLVNASEEYGFRLSDGTYYKDDPVPAPVHQVANPIGDGGNSDDGYYLNFPAGDSDSESAFPGGSSVHTSDESTVSSRAKRAREEEFDQYFGRGRYAPRAKKEEPIPGEVVMADAEQRARQETGADDHDLSSSSEGGNVVSGGSDSGGSDPGGNPEEASGAVDVAIGDSVVVVDSVELTDDPGVVANDTSGRSETETASDNTRVVLFSSMQPLATFDKDGVENTEGFQDVSDVEGHLDGVPASGEEQLVFSGANVFGTVAEKNRAIGAIAPIVDKFYRAFNAKSVAPPTDEQFGDFWSHMTKIAKAKHASVPGVVAARR